ncbi:MAG: hypothetical protein J6K61_04925 [Clostridia bacterium]|nr:hypothetical protein [Clostridia bacterium]
MFIYKNIHQALQEERQKSAALLARQKQIQADMDYIAMMTDVSLDGEESYDEI